MVVTIYTRDNHQKSQNVFLWHCEDERVRNDEEVNPVLLVFFGKFSLSTQMSTHLPGFHSFVILTIFFASFCIGTRVKNDEDVKKVNPNQSIKKERAVRMNAAL